MRGDTAKITLSLSKSRIVSENSHKSSHILPKLSELIPQNNSRIGLVMHFAPENTPNAPSNTAGLFKYEDVTYMKSDVRGLSGSSLTFPITAKKASYLFGVYKGESQVRRGSDGRHVGHFRFRRSNLKLPFTTHCTVL